VQYLSGSLLALAVMFGGCGGGTNGSDADSGPSGGSSTGGGSDGSGGTVGQPPPTTDPVERPWGPNDVEARVKSPGQRMHFTAGLPFRILADANDPMAYECPPGHPPYACSDSSVTFLIDGAAVGTVPPDPNNQNLWELRLPGGLSAGDHVITVRFQPHAAAPVDGLVPVYIHVDPVPVHANTVTLTSDLVLSGSTDLVWDDAVVRGNGHTVRAAPGYSGKVLIHDSLVTGLAAFDNQLGVDVTTTGGVDISGSIFEATAPLRLVVNGSAPISLVGNELRSTNYVTYVSADPTRSPILDISGSTTGTKMMQGNNIGAGIVHITGMSGWQIGGLRDSQSNIFIGPRCVLNLEDSPNATIQGNYLHHDYYGGFSQGFNLQFSGSSDHALAEHNVIRDSSWPLQTFGGEFRYNLMINSGHDFVRSSRAQARYHHNIFAHAQAPGSGYDGAVLMYNGETGIVFDNNTIDAGGTVGAFDAPALVLGSSATSVASLRNNLFSQFSPVRDWSQSALIAGGKSEASVGSRIATADYNAWWNPLAEATAHYAPGIAGPSPGTHDVTSNPQLTGPVPQAPFVVSEGAVWTRAYGVSSLLAYYRALYTPKAGSPLIDTGDPADGAGTDIGAVGAGAPNSADKFGSVMTAN
jgi:hypothetical protein